jgi:hypothetical protein
VDIPAVALTQWPDKTYHTSADSLDHIDPAMLRRSAALAGAYCYIYSRFTYEDAGVVIPAVSSRFFERIISLPRNKACSDVKERCEYIRDIYFATLNRILTLFDEKELGELLPVIEEEKKFFLQLEQIYCGGGEKQDMPSSPVPVRLFKAPLAFRCIIGDMTPDEKQKLHNLRCKYPNLAALDDYIMYEADGKRTVEDIARRVYFQTGTECGKYVNELFQMLTDLGLARLN